jgi:hypothetical protein
LTINFNEEIEPVPGIPPGALYSHFFANIYLDEFDKLAQTLTLDYARYVDDICFVCDSLDELEKAKSELSNYLNRWGQKFKEVGKTIKSPILQIEPLYEHTRKMKYATRLDVVEAYEESAEAISMVGVTEKPFFRLYRLAENEGNLSRLADEAGYVIAFLKKSGDKDLANVIYSLLETHPVRPSTLKAVLLYLLELEHPSPSKQFIDFFFGNQERAVYISALFLRLLVYFEWKIDLRAEIIRTYCGQKNYLVRASAYFALSKIEGRFEYSFFASLLSKEESIYAKARLINSCGVVDDRFDIYSTLGFLENTHLSVPAIKSYTSLIEDNKVEQEFINTIWGFLKDKDISFEFLIYMFYLSATQGYFWVNEEILKRDTAGRFAAITPSLSLEVIDELAKQPEIIRLHTFANQVQKLGFLDTALVGYYEVSDKTPNDQLSSEIAAVVNSIEIKAGLPQWIAEAETTRHIYRQSANDKDYLCQYIDDHKNHKGILEIITFERIKSSGFSSYEEWGEYLTQLSQNLIIPPISLVKYSDTKFACYYEIPEGYSSIAKIIASDVARESLTQNNVLQLGEGLLENIEKLQNPNFFFHSIDPLSVLWSPLTGRHFLVGIGASLGTGKYQCGVDGCKEPTGEDEIGVTATIFHFGLFIFQLLSFSCPIEKMHAVRSKYLPIPLSDLLNNLNVLPHYRMILGRALNPDPDKRYEDIRHLLSDLKQANRLKKDLDTPGRYDEKTRLTIILVDFMLFRLRVILRNPTLPKDSSIPRSKTIIDELANTVKYLPESLVEFWNVGLERHSHYVEFPDRNEVKKSSLEGTRLIDIAYGWEKVCDSYNLRNSHLTALSRVFLFRSFAVEALASYSGLLANLSESQFEKIKSRSIDFSEQAERILGHQQDETEISIKVNSAEHIIFLSKRDLFELQRLPLWRQGDVNYYSYISCLKVLGIFLVLSQCSVELKVNGEVAYFENCAHKKVSFDEKSIWALLYLFPALDKQIESLQEVLDGSEDNNIVNNDVWLNFADLFTFITKLNPARRKPGHIYSYQEKSYKLDADGRLEFGLFWKQGMKFDTKWVFVSGNPKSLDQDIQRPILFDLVKLSDKTEKITSVFAPIGRFVELPFKKRRIPFLNISMFIYKQKRKYEVFRLGGIIFIGLVISWFAGSAVAMLTGSPHPILAGGVGVLSAVSTYFLTTYGERLIKNIDPEDYDLVGRANRK